MASRQVVTNSIIRLGGMHFSEHNRSPLSVNPVRIKNDKRTLRGEMRRQVIDVKHEFSVSWSDIPHVAAYTVDRKPGGRDMKTFFEANPGELTLAIGRRDNTTETYTVFIDNFTYSIRKRWDYEFWDCSLDLVEV